MDRGLISSVLLGQAVLLGEAVAGPTLILDAILAENNSKMTSNPAYATAPVSTNKVWIVSALIYLFINF